MLYFDFLDVFKKVTAVLFEELLQFTVGVGGEAVSYGFVRYLLAVLGDGYNGRILPVYASSLRGLGMPKPLRMKNLAAATFSLSLSLSMSSMLEFL